MSVLLLAPNSGQYSDTLLSKLSMPFSIKIARHMATIPLPVECTQTVVVGVHNSVLSLFLKPPARSTNSLPLE